MAAPETTFAAAPVHAETVERPPVAVIVWLYGLAALVAVTVLVGGATRLTDAGLSITEWLPVGGALPPLSEAAWNAAFEKYRQIPEYQQVNRGMSLDAFKVIFWWEWTHRLLGRSVGLAFIVPFAGFLATGRLKRRHAPPLIALFALGGLQGAVGWWMVASGLVERVDVSQLRLAVHLTLACVILLAILWVAATLGRKPDRPDASGIRRVAAALVVLVLVQIFLGGLVAGLDAGLAHNTWPLMDGRLVPPGLMIQEPAWRNLFDNARAVQFNHRVAAYALVVLGAVHVLQLLRAGGQGHLRRASYVGCSIAVQVAIGIATLLATVPFGLALAHQAGALVVIAAAASNLAAALGYGASRQGPVSVEMRSRRPVAPPKTTIV